MWVPAFLPFYANDVLGDVEGREFHTYAVRSTGGISCWRSDAPVVFLFCRDLLVLRVDVGLQFAVHFDVWGQPSEELS